MYGAPTAGAEWRWVTRAASPSLNGRRSNPSSVLKLMSAIHPSDRGHGHVGLRWGSACLHLGMLTTPTRLKAPAWCTAWWQVGVTASLPIVPCAFSETLSPALGKTAYSLRRLSKTLCLLVFPFTQEISSHFYRKGKLQWKITILDDFNSSTFTTSPTSCSISHTKKIKRTRKENFF